MREVAEKLSEGVSQGAQFALASIDCDFCIIKTPYPKGDEDREWIRSAAMQFSPTAFSQIAPCKKYAVINAIYSPESSCSRQILMNLALHSQLLMQRKQRQADGPYGEASDEEWKKASKT